MQISGGGDFIARNPINEKINQRSYRNFRIFLGFTLAEVLITIGIIGIVAAMTLPNVINRVQNKNLEVAFKKQYSVISQVLNKMYYEGICTTTDCVSANDIYSAFQKHAQVVRTCASRNDDESLCFTWHSDEGYRSFMKKWHNVVTDQYDDFQVITADGALIGMDAYNGIATIGVDVNGKKKGPNIFGYDLFLFTIKDVGDRGVLAPYSTGDCNFTGRDSAYNGQGCSSYALSDPNYFKNLH